MKKTKVSKKTKEAAFAQAANRGGHKEAENRKQQTDKGIGLGGVLKIAWPAVFESFFISLAGMIDTLMVSSIGPEAVAAVGLTTQPKFLGLAVFIAMNVAVAAIVARRKG